MTNQTTAKNLLNELHMIALSELVGNNDMAYAYSAFPVGHDELYVEVMVNETDAAYMIYSMFEAVPFVTKSKIEAVKTLEVIFTAF